MYTPIIFLDRFAFKIIINVAIEIASHIFLLKDNNKTSKTEINDKIKFKLKTLLILLINLEI